MACHPEPPFTPEQEERLRETAAYIAAALIDPKRPIHVDGTVNVHTMPKAWRSPFWAGWSLFCGAWTALMAILTAIMLLRPLMRWLFA